MQKLTSIPGIGKSSQELLEVAGFLNVESLAKAGIDQLVTELERANGILKIAKRTPPRASVEKWVHAAREAIGMNEEQELAQERDPEMPVNYEGNPAVLEMLDRSPCAIPLPVRVMMDGGLAVADIPPAIFLNRYAGDLEVRVSSREPEKQDKAEQPLPEPKRETRRDVRREPVRSISANIQRAKGPEPKLDIDTLRVKTFEEFAETPVHRPTRETRNENDRVALLRAPKDDTNRGKDPNSRWYIRGVLHTHPVSLALGALVTILLVLMLPVAIVSAGLLLVSDQFPLSFEWVPKWILAFPASLVPLAILYFLVGLDGKCRICGQRLFWPRNCLKNSKAHHVPLIGYILPVSLHMLVFRWFRCTYCGTPVRLKK